MSKSTPLSELNSTTETQPLVHDILKEIQQESSPNNVEPQEQVVQPPQVATQPSQESAPDVSAGQMVEPDKEAIYQQQQQDAQTYQMDPNLQNPEMSADTIPEQVMEAPLVNPAMETEYSAPPASMGRRIFTEVKEPLLVAVLTILVSVPAVSQFLGSTLAKVPGGSNFVVPVVVKSLLVAALFYLGKKLI